MSPPSVVDFSREITADLGAAEQREWLVTNGLGGFASGTVAGLLTRRYHGLLIAALKPPGARTFLVAKLDETAEFEGEVFPLFTNRWAGGTVAPQGFRHIDRFRLEGTTPVWTFAFADALLEKRVWMPQGANTTYIQYCSVRSSRPLTLTLKALVNYRDYHSVTGANNRRFDVQPVERGLRIVACEGATPFYMLSDRADAAPAHIWQRNFDLAAERLRGLEEREDHLHAGTFRAQLSPGDSITVVLSTDPAPGLDGRAAREACQARDRRLHARWARTVAAVGACPDAVGDRRSSALRERRYSKHAPAWIRQLVLAADQFIAARPGEQERDARSVIAGYPWFGEWGRDTMVSLPGLTLVTGRPEIACRILRTWACYCDRGMLPNFLPETGGTPEYNSVDATLWYFEAVRQYYAATSDRRLLHELFPVLADAIDWHVRGTRHGIHVDPADGLLYAGESGVPLTWMDAKVGEWVMTPRIGKPVEVNALWLNALASMAQFARLLKKPAKPYVAMARRARASFQRFWNDAAGYCFDVISGPEGDDASLRPNQILAVSLPVSPLTPAQQRAVVDVCARHLLTPYGLRTLAPGDPRYRGCCEGAPHDRDAAYHQGTAWGWLLGPFVLAHLRVYNDAERARTFLNACEHHLKLHGVGTASEIFDGDPPHTPQGCIAQAWTVAEVLRAWHATGTSRSPVRGGKG
jgi:glycogen debranching enzyme